MGETIQVKTKKRVADHGEVFTNDREVNATLDLVKQETGRIESHFLEPARGNGNFLAEVLRRKYARLIIDMVKVGPNGNEIRQIALQGEFDGFDLKVLSCRRA